MSKRKQYIFFHSFINQLTILKKTFEKLRSFWWENMFAFSCDLPIYSLAYSPHLCQNCTSNLDKKCNSKESEKERFCKIMMNDFDSKFYSRKSTTWCRRRKKKIIDNAFFVHFSFVVLKRHFCEPFVSFLWYNCDINNLGAWNLLQLFFVRVLTSEKSEWFQNGWNQSFL